MEMLGGEMDVKLEKTAMEGLSEAMAEAVMKHVLKLRSARTAVLAAAQNEESEKQAIMATTIAPTPQEGT